MLGGFDSMRGLTSGAAALLLAAAAAVQAQPAPQAGSGQTAPVQNPPAAQVPVSPQQRPPQPPLGPNQWRIDGGHSQANFSVRHNVVSTVRGQLGPISGTIEYDGKDVQSVKADVAIDVTRVNTQNERRDNHLRQDDFFNTEKFPRMTFKSRRVEPVSEGKFRLIGDLTIRDKTHEVVLEVEGPSPVMKSQRGILTGATANTKISRKQFDVLWNRMIESMPVVSDEVQITIDLELTRPAAPGTTQQ
jgi:polyisoprenoid-binding protein YceI